MIIFAGSEKKMRRGVNGFKKARRPKKSISNGELVRLQ